MHDLIQEMGHKIVRDQDDKNPGKRSRLWIADDVCHVLKKKKGTDAIECLAMSMDRISYLDIEPSAFKEMPNLRLLKLQFELYSYWDSKSCVNKVHLPRGLECLPEALRILHWDACPLNSLPSKFYPENLVELCLRDSRLQRLWDKDLKINLGSLKRIDLTSSKHLVEVQDLSGSPNLEIISLDCCGSLVQLPLSFQHLAKLTKLNLYGCYSLKKLPEMPGNLETLSLTLAAIEELPSSIWSLEQLDELRLSSCKKLKNLPSSPCRLNSLRSLYLDDCLSLESLAAELPSGLKILYLSNCRRLGSLPVELPPGLNELRLSNCKSLGSLPVELPPGLNELDLSYCVSLGSLPVNLPSGLVILNLSNCVSLGSLPVELPAGLDELDLRNCKSLGSLPELPWLLTQLDADGCTSLETVSGPMRTAPMQGRDQYVNNSDQPWYGFYEKLLFINCVKLDQSALSNIMADARLRVMRYASTEWSEAEWSEEFRFLIEIVFPGNEIPKWMSYRREGCKIKIKLPPNWFRQGFLGYALCIVVAFNNYKQSPDIDDPCCFGCETHHETNNGHKGRCDLDIRLPDDIILNSYHVFLWHFHPDSVPLRSTINREDWVKASEASFDFKLYQTSWEEFDAEKIPLDLSTVWVEIIKTKRLRLN